MLHHDNLLTHYNHKVQFEGCENLHNFEVDFNNGFEGTNCLKIG